MKRWIGIGIGMALSWSAMAYGELIVRLQPGVDPQRIAQDYDVIYRDGAPGGLFYLFEVPGKRDPHITQQQMQQDQRVVWAEDNLTVEMPEHSGAGKANVIGAIGNDNEFYEMNRNLLSQIRWLPPLTPFPTREIRVAILDTGLSPYLPQLWSRVRASYNAVEGDDPGYDVPRGQDTSRNGEADEGVGHGTMVTGVVAQLAPHSKFVIARVADSDGIGTAWTLVKGLAFAVQAGAHVVNISLGSLQRIPALSEMVDYVSVEHPITVVGAAGNNGLRARFYPAGISDCISVTGVDPQDVKAPFANWDSSVDHCAPATGIRSYYWNGKWAVWSGTSFAAPMCTAAIAAAFELGGTRSPLTIRNAFDRYGDDVDNRNPQYRGEIGLRLNFTRFVIGVATSLG
jgi:hypothetical protein